LIRVQAAPARRWRTNEISVDEFAREVIDGLRTWSQFAVKRALKHRSESDIVETLAQIWTSCENQVKSNPNRFDHHLCYTNVTLKKIES
jgi:hypothetical protein